MKKIKPDILGGTFSNLHIANKKVNIASIVEEMGIEENKIIKLLTSSPRNEYLRLRLLRKKKNNIHQSKTLTNNFRTKKASFPLIQKKEKFKNGIKNLLFSDKNINKINNKKESPLNKRNHLLNKNDLNINDSQYLSEKRERNNKNSEEIKKSPGFDKKTKLQTIYDPKGKKINLFSLNKKLEMKTINKANNNNNKLIQRNNFISESINKEDKDEYYQTAKLFSEQKLFNRKIQNKKKTLLSKTKSENQVKKIPRLKISEAYLTDIENKLNTVYEWNKNDLIEKDKVIKDFKKKYQNLFDYNERAYGSDIAQASKEINEQLLSLKFKDFYSYLLTILKNYDKHIVDWKFNIDKDTKQCPEELRLKNVKIKHKRFMKKLNKQYDSGMKANKIMDDLLLNSKKKAMFYKYLKNQNNNFNDYINKKLNPDDLVDKIFDKNQMYHNNLINDEI
jgi:hypothetical protein